MICDIEHARAIFNEALCLAKRHNSKGYQARILHKKAAPEEASGYPPDSPTVADLRLKAVDLRDKVEDDFGLKAACTPMAYVTSDEALYDRLLCVLFR
jgi:hypothetical protein